jgi:hypothetical protein
MMTAADEIGPLGPPTNTRSVRRKKRAARDSNREERSTKKESGTKKRSRIDELV